MKIDKYGFGTIVIDGKEYTKDLLVFPDHVRENWWRQRGHALCISDLQEVLAFEPETLIVGCGFFSMLKVPQLVVAELEARGIACRAMSSKRAVEAFNERVDSSRVVLGIHLTC